MSLVYGVAALARPTFDVPYAEEMKERAFRTLEAAGIKTIGPSALLFDADAARAALAEIEQHRIDALLILQVTFTDATMTVEIGRRAKAPLAIWALPEPRAGGRLRLNAFCGLNLAAHALGKAAVPHGWLYAAPDARGISEDLRTLRRPNAAPPTRAAKSAAASDACSLRALEAVRGARIAVIGEHPAGFDTCDYDAGALMRLAGVEVVPVALPHLFERARALPCGLLAQARKAAARRLGGLETLDRQSLNRSLRIFCALDDIASETGASALAVRCWPEVFTDYGCAACGPMAMMNGRKVPSACEADVYGAFSALLLQELAREPSWMADLVDVDFDRDTGVFWHCGLAPLSMCDPDFRPRATVHSNRGKPLLHEFPLKPGRFTIARLSQARGEMKLVIGGGEFLKAPMAFTGTSGVFSLDRPLTEVVDIVMSEALEHHYAIAYGDHRAALRAIAASLALPLLEIA